MLAHSSLGAVSYKKLLIVKNCIKICCYLVSVRNRKAKEEYYYDIQSMISRIYLLNHICHSQRFQLPRLKKSIKESSFLYFLFIQTKFALKEKPTTSQIHYYV